MTNKLPKGWVWTRLEEVLKKFESGGRPKGGVKNIESGIPSIGGEHLTWDGGFDFTNIRYVPNSFFEKMSKGIIRKGDILIVKDGATTGKTSIVREDFAFGKAAVNEHVFLARPFKEVDNLFLFYYLFSTHGQNYIQKNFKGTAQGGINLTFAKNTFLPLPPLPEQRYIVAKIEELFSDLDAGVEALKKIKEQLKRYRQTVLKYAFEGKLTADWRQRMLNEEQENSKLKKLPEGWVWKEFKEVTEIVLGQSPPSSTYNSKGLGLPFFQGKAEFQELYPDIKKWCTFPKKIAEKGDVLISVRAPVGPTNISPEKSCIGRGLAAIKPNKRIASKYILYVCRAFKNDIAKEATGTTFKAITGSQLKSFKIPYTKIDEQHKIVEEIERRFSIADEVEKVVDQSLKQAERLRQSILKKAFEGKLVPQDPSDPPASELLEQIKAKKVKKRKVDRKKLKF